MIRRLDVYNVKADLMNGIYPMTMSTEDLAVHQLRLPPSSGTELPSLPISLVISLFMV